MTNTTYSVATAALLLCAAGCDLDGAAAPRVLMDVVVGGIDDTDPAPTDLGYEIEVTRFRAAIENVEFTTDGEMHARRERSVLDTLHGLVIPTAFAHPGHAAGGEVVGELRGKFVLDFLEHDHPLMGAATMLGADYSGANLGLTRAEVGPGIDVGDPMIGHTFDVAGIARVGEKEIAFEVLLDEDEDRRIIGLPFELTVDEGSEEMLGLYFHVTDPVLSENLFDGVDFAALDDDDDGMVTIEPDSEAYNLLRRKFQVHSHYAVDSVGGAQ